VEANVLLNVRTPPSCGQSLKSKTLYELPNTSTPKLRIDDGTTIVRGINCSGVVWKPSTSNDWLPNPVI
jgi:hypothetical protein